MKRGICIVVCLVCLLVIADGLGVPVSKVIFAMCRNVEQFIEEKTRPDSLYGKGIQWTIAEEKTVPGTNLDLLRMEQEKKYQERVSQYIDDCISGMSLEEKLAQMLILTNRKDITKVNLETCQPGGILFFLC